MTKQEAEQKLTEAQRIFRDKYCPVVKGNCKAFDCHSFFKGSMNEYPTQGFNIFNPCCTCALVTGIIEHDGA